MRFTLFATVIVLLLLVVPVDTFDPTPRLTAEGGGAEACDVVTPAQVRDATTATSIDVEASRVDSDDDRLGESFPFVKRTVCDYEFAPSCVRTNAGVDVTDLRTHVITMADAERGRRRYEAGRIENMNPSRLHLQTFRDHDETEGLSGYSVASAPNRVVLVHLSGRYLSTADIWLCRPDSVALLDTTQRLYEWWTTQLRTSAEFG